MRNWRAGYWRVYNVLVRALGTMAFLSGLGFIVWGAVRMLQMGLQASEAFPGLVLLFVGFIAAGLGASILGVPAYRPDLGDPAWHFDPFGKRTHQSQASRRSWWTGDR
jgi:hypothetical protein